MSVLDAVEEAGAAQAAWIGACEAAYPKVFRALVAMGASSEDAADAIQNAFERALAVRGATTSPDGWLFVVALRRWRRGRWRQRLFGPLDLLRGHAAAGRSRDEELDLLAELARLTERQRTVLVARYAVGLSQKEIGELLGITSGTVAAIAHQATRKLRQRLGGSK
ncbi:MAG: sigma-70 family RNA polymerase sigma factor [Chloroflexota bacterium]|nr:sigma-70 family RNA polymerase sigma factor [Chloroflexota bacterium]